MNYVEFKKCLSNDFNVRIRIMTAEMSGIILELESKLTANQDNEFDSEILKKQNHKVLEKIDALSNEYITSIKLILEEEYQISDIE